MDGKKDILRALKRLTGTLKSAPVGWILFDKDRRAVQIDADIADLLSLDLAIALGSPLTDLLPEPHWPPLLAAFEQPDSPQPLSHNGTDYVVAVTKTPKGTLLAIADPSRPTQEQPAPAQAPNTEEPRLDTADQDTRFLAQIVEARTLTELSHALVVSMEALAPQTAGFLAVPVLDSLVPVASWPQNTAATPVLLDEVQAVRQGRKVTYQPQQPESLLPQAQNPVHHLPVYRNTEFVCLIVSDAPLSILEKVAYFCGLQLQRLQG